MLYARILAYVSSTPWALLPEKLAEITAFLAVRADGREIAEKDIARIVAARASSSMRTAGAIAVLPIMGVLHHRADMMTESSGGASVEKLSAQLRSLVENPAIAAVLLDVSSPGGSVEGITEFSSEIYEARAVKPVWAIAHSLMASASYWLGASASELVAAPSSQLGAVGVLGAHQDLSKALEAAGVKTTLISAGKYKAEGSPFEPLSDEARAFIQSRVDAHHDQFIKDIARGRGVAQKAARDGFGQGRMLGAADAVKAGMADRVDTFKATLDRLARKVGGIPGASASALADDIYRALGAKLQERAEAPAAEDPIAPSDDGACPDGYEKGEDGMCHLVEDDGAGARADLDYRLRRHRMLAAGG